MELMARDHPSFNFEAPFYMSTTYLIAYVKSCEMSHESWKTKRNVMQNARDVMWKLKNQAKCDAKCKGCCVKVEKPSEMWCKIQEMSCESWKTKQNVRSQNARNVMWKLRKPSKMWGHKMQGMSCESWENQAKCKETCQDMSADRNNDLCRIIF